MNDDFDTFDKLSLGIFFSLVIIFLGISIAIYGSVLGDMTTKDKPTTYKTGLTTHTTNIQPAIDGKDLR